MKTPLLRFFSIAFKLTISWAVGILMIASFLIIWRLSYQPAKMIADFVTHPIN